jgi:hypothetical protein
MSLTQLEMKTLLAVAETMLPSSPKLPGADLAVISAFVADFMRRAPFHFRVGVRLAIYLIMLAPLPFLGRCCLFPQLTTELRQHLLHSLLRHRSYMIREIPVMLKMLISLGYCGLPQVQQAIGISPSDSNPADWLSHPSPRERT